MSAAASWGSRSEESWEVAERWGHLEKLRMVILSVAQSFSEAELGTTMIFHPAVMARALM